MSKTKKRFKDTDSEDEARQERVLEQLKQSGRTPVPPSGYFHDTGEKQQRRKNRKEERTRLKNLTREYNNEI